jgi:hypothetical protein
MIGGLVGGHSGGGGPMMMGGSGGGGTVQMRFDPNPSPISVPYDTSHVVSTSSLLITYQRKWPSV